MDTISTLAAHLAHHTTQLVHNLGIQHMLTYAHTATQAYPATAGAAVLSVLSIVRHGHPTLGILLATLVALVVGILCDREGMLPLPIPCMQMTYTLGQQQHLFAIPPRPPSSNHKLQCPHPLVLHCSSVDTAHTRPAQPTPPPTTTPSHLYPHHATRTTPIPCLPSPPWAIPTHHPQNPPKRPQQCRHQPTQHHHWVCVSVTRQSSGLPRGGAPVTQEWGAHIRGGPFSRGGAFSRGPPFSWVEFSEGLSAAAGGSSWWPQWCRRGT